jgi:hypothetical protein
MGLSDKLGPASARIGKSKFENVMRAGDERVAVVTTQAASDNCSIVVYLILVAWQAGHFCRGADGAYERPRKTAGSSRWLDASW